MKIKQAYVSVIVLTLLASASFVSIAGTNAQTQESISVVLESPANNTAKTDNFNVTFTYIPYLFGSDKFYGASLTVNGSVVLTNQTMISNNTVNSIAYTFASENATYYWNIRVQNKTSVVEGTQPRNITFVVYVPEPTATPTPTPTPVPTVTSTPTVWPTATPTPNSSTPTPTPVPNELLGTWGIVIIAIIVIASVGAIAILVLRRRSQAQ